MRVLLNEHCQKLVSKEEGIDQAVIWQEEIFKKVSKDSIRLFKVERGKKIYPFSIEFHNEHTCAFQADYYVGVDWLIKGEKYVQVEPKINQVIEEVFTAQLEREEVTDQTNEKIENEVKQAVNNTTSYEEVDYLKMLLTVYSGLVKEGYLKDIVLIDWEDKKIPIEQVQDHLTPFIIVQFLQLLKKIVRKGLKKSYYKVQENLNGRVKGKILIGQQLKQNVFKNRLTSTLCEYQVFGTDSVENRFLKKVFRFVCSYVENKKEVFKSNWQSINELIGFCRPPFELIGDEVDMYQLKHLKVNAFFKEYKEAVKIGQFILKRFAYNISKTTVDTIETPPFWIDMPRLFELYVYHHLLRSNPDNKQDILFQFSTFGNALDILIANKEYAMVIDTKYKLHYNHGHIHEDIRQVSGYARLNKVLDKIEKAGYERETILPCLIIYPSKEGIDLEKSTVGFSKMYSGQTPISVYHKVYKFGVKLPMIEN